MYERNAIVLERYFNQIFGYDMKNNIKTNFKDYCELVECLEKYKDVLEEEEIIIQEYDAIANKIREKQTIQENLNNKNNKLQDEINNIFQNIDENVEKMQKKIEVLTDQVQEVNKDIKENAQEFARVITEFNEKSNVRVSCGRERRNIEKDYNKKLNETLDNYQEIDIEIERRAKGFIEIETANIEKELKQKINKNGEKEKIPFNLEVITKAIALSVDIQKRETDILANIYDKTNKLFTEIKSNSTKIEKHKKIIKDSKSKLEFVSAIKDYLIQFLDNERLTAVNGEEEHQSLMKEACKNLDEDLVQINNLYTLLLKEISKKITKKSYTELYNLNYLEELKDKAEDFDSQIKKLKLPVTIINPNYWRIEGMQKIYDVFYKCVTEYYDRDLSEFMPQEDEEEDYEEDDFELSNSNEDEIYTEIQEDNKDDEDLDINLSRKDKKSKSDNEEDEDDIKSEIDRKIDMILGFDMNNNEEDDDDDWEEDIDFEEDDEMNEEIDEEDEFDIFGDEKVNNKNDDDNYEEDDEADIWGDDDDFDFGEDDEEEEDLFEEDAEDNDEDIDEEDDEKEKDEENWENEFINMDKKDKKKKGFFDKFKK